MSHQRMLDLPADPTATEAFGERLGALLRPGDTLALCGDLGAGKTTLVRGLGRGLGLDDPEAVSSPTYLLVLEHPGRVPLLHADAYLPGKLRGFLADGGLDYLLDTRCAVAVEWGDRVRELLPENTLWLEIAVAPDAGRRLTLRWQDGERLARLCEMPKMGVVD